MSASRLLVGIGSPHGNDRVGWEIARRVGERIGSALVVRCARTPVELLDWLEGIDTLDVCDAVSSSAAGSIHCWRWPAPEIERISFRGSHDFALPEVLVLAETLGRLPREARIWGLGVRPSAPFGSLSPEVVVAIPAVVKHICEALVPA